MFRAAVTKEPLKEMLGQPLQCKEGRAGYSGWLSTRGEHLLKKWKRRWAVVWNNCIVMYRTRRPEERSLLAIPLFKLSSANGVLLSYKLDSESGAVAECQKGSIFFDAGHTVEALVWLDTVRANASLSRHFAASRAKLQQHQLQLGVFGVVPPILKRPCADACMKNHTCRW